MLELAASQPRKGLDPHPTWETPPGTGLVLTVARSHQDLEAIQRLRYDVFTENWLWSFRMAAMAWTPTVTTPGVSTSW